MSTPGDSHATTQLIDLLRAMGVTISHAEAERWAAGLSAQRVSSIEPDAVAAFRGYPLPNAGGDGAARQGLAQKVGAGAIAEFVELLTEEVFRYSVSQPNLGKAARRMYDIFLLTDRYREAAFVRELFDAPTTALYQAAAVLDALNGKADQPPGDGDALVVLVDRLIMSAVFSLDQPAAQLVRRLIRLRRELAERTRSGMPSVEIERLREAAVAAVHAHFELVLTATPSMDSYLKSVASTRGMTAR